MTDSPHSTEKVLDAGEVCPDLANRRVNFFSGRLLSADDMRQEQSAVSQRDRRLGTAIGSGVVRGLEVHAEASAANLLQIEAGLAITGCGEPLVGRLMMLDARTMQHGPDLAFDLGGVAAFSVGVEMLNIRLRKKAAKPVDLREPYAREFNTD